MTNLKNLLPEAVNKFNVYKNGTRLIGVTDEVSLADLNGMTETVQGAGMLGTYNTAITGMYESIKQEIPFNMLFDDTFSMADPTEVQELTLRASLQSTVKTTGSLDYTGMRFVFRGRPIEFKPGSMKQGGKTGSSVSLECIYILYELDGRIMFELDKLNNVFKVHEKDLLEKIRSQC